MAPLGFLKRVEESPDFLKLPMGLRPLKVLLKSQLLLDGHGLMPCREDERKWRLPSAGWLLARVFQQAKELIPMRWHRHQSVVGGAVGPEGIEI